MSDEKQKSYSHLIKEAVQFRLEKNFKEVAKDYLGDFEEEAPSEDGKED